MKYRKEIDGLRAISVLSVIFFHLNIQYFKGGFIGVDVFFVISGYLITKIIYQELSSNNFSLLSFYERRVRRLFPTLFIVLIPTTLLSWIIMLPNEFKQYTDTIISTLLYFSNIYFWSNSDYFDTVAEYSPLLHTWSLSLEEQFYILFPIALLYFYKVIKNKLFLILFFTTFFSFFLSIYASGIYESANFYLLPTRAWEILIGSMVAIYELVIKKKVINKNLISFVSSIAFFLIISSFYFFDNSIPHPSFFTLIPTLSTAVLLYFLNFDIYLKKVLSQKTISYIGLLSYSLYLWHYPMISLFKLEYEREPGTFEKITILLLSFLLSIITYELVETKFKNRNNFKRKNIYISSVFFIIFGLTFSFVIKNTSLFENKRVAEMNQEQLFYYEIAVRDTNSDTLDSRLDDKRCKFFVQEINEELYERFQICKNLLNENAYILFGDSHAINLHNIIFQSTKSNFFITIANGGARPEFKESENRYTHYEYSQFINSNSDRIDTVYYHQSGSHLIYDYKQRTDSSEAFIEKNSYSFNIFDINQKFEYLNSLDVRTVWIGPFYEPRKNIVRSILKNNLNFSLSPIMIDRFDELDSEIEQIAQSKDTQYLKFNEIYKIKESDVFVGECLIWRDTDHLSLCGENIISKTANFP